MLNLATCQAEYFIAQKDAVLLFLLLPMQFYRPTTRNPLASPRRHLRRIPQSRNPAAAKEEAGYEKPATFNSAIGRTPVTFH